MGVTWLYSNIFPGDSHIMLWYVPINRATCTLQSFLFSRWAALAEANHSGEEGKIHDNNEAPRAGTAAMHLPSALSTAAASNQPSKRLAPSANSSYSIQIYIFSLCQRQQCIAYKCRWCLSSLHHDVTFEDINYDGWGCGMWQCDEWPDEQIKLTFERLEGISSSSCGWSGVFCNDN